MDFSKFIRPVIMLIILIPGYYVGLLISAFVPFRPYRWLRMLIYICLGMVSCTVIFNNDIVNITYAYIGFLLVILIGYEGPTLHKFSASVILYLFVPSINYLLDTLLFFSPFLNPYLSSSQTSLLDYALPGFRMVFIALLWYGVYQLFYKKIRTLRDYATTRVWILLDIISCGSLLLTGYIIVTTSNQMQLYSIPIIMISLLTEVGILYLTAYMAESSHTAVENENLKNQQHYYEELEQNQLEIRKLRHDMNNHIGTISAYLEADRIEEARQYFSELTKTVRSSGKVFCSNNLVNTVINNKYQQAESLSIDTFFHIDLDNMIPMSDVELCSLFANTLDNALEACSQISDPSLRKIELKARCKNNFFSYQISNSYIGEVKKSSGRYLSSKEHPKEHGLGLMSVDDIVKKHNGTLEINAENHIFTLTCILPTR